MKPAIRVDNLSKLYRLGARGAGYRTLREAIANATVASWRWLSRAARGPLSLAANGRADHAFVGKPADTLWALKDVSFEVRPGEVIGIIGRNGAGKSTLLKILSRITEPTAGRVELRGRVSSLLEVGTGFHQELTGRENVYLNGAILGMTRREIQRKFDEIVAFAGVEQFLDTPVKRYSSGMYVRLAFAVAAHLEPEILIVDEVLAVGDMAFQNKCLGKMDEVSRSGRTVLFVSHNMAAVEGLCHRGIVLESGRLHCDADVKEAIQSYLDLARTTHTKNGYRFVLDGRSSVSDGFQVKEVWITSEGKTDPMGFPTGAPLEFHLRCYAARGLIRPIVSIRINKVGSGSVTKLHSQRSGSEPPTVVEGEFVVTCSTSDLLLAPGEYLLRLGIKSGEEPLQVIDDAGHFVIRATDFFGTGRPQEPGDGCVVCRQRWQFEVKQ
jgi:lipopolysaccharide transport system ATP-binding protein